MAVHLPDPARGRAQRPGWSTVAGAGLRVGALLGLVLCTATASRRGADPISVVQGAPRHAAVRLALDVRRHRTPPGYVSESPTDMESKEYGSAAWLAQFPDSAVVRTNDRAKEILLLVWTPTESCALTLWVNDERSRLVVARYEKPSGVDHLLFSWNLSDSTRARVPTGSYAVGATAGAITRGGALVLAGDGD
jgi:hypothetical protein